MQTLYDLFICYNDFDSSKLSNTMFRNKWRRPVHLMRYCISLTSETLKSAVNHLKPKNLFNALNVCMFFFVCYKIELIFKTIKVSVEIMNKKCNYFKIKVIYLQQRQMT